MRISVVNLSGPCKAMSLLMKETQKSLYLLEKCGEEVAVAAAPAQQAGEEDDKQAPVVQN